jgi:ring-1,2-phenylacetyl-CoA epoxidase subunit PaaE
VSLDTILDLRHHDEVDLAGLYRVFRRDLTHMANNWRGQRRPPFTQRRAPAPAASPATALHARTLVVRQVVHETADAISVELADPTGQPIAFAPGQFFTLLVTIDGEELRRAYSACSSAAAPGSARIAIKRVAGGRVSNHLCDGLAAGATLRVLGPSGSFGPKAGRAPRHLVLVAGGSGITPMMAIARTLLVTEPETRISLLYGNRAEGDIIFRDALADLAGPRLSVRHVLSDPPPAWSGGVGLLDEVTCARELELLADDDDGRPREYFVCGPAPMMAAARVALRARGVADDDIHEERFTTLQPRRDDAGAAAGPHTVQVRRRGTVQRFVAAPGQTLLEAGLAAGADLPFSCTVGGCGACTVRLVEGAVTMEEPNCLTREERAAGDVLACVGRPTSAVLLEVA